jgi:polar amino acid transport system permease protein
MIVPILKIAIRALARNKGRSALTMLGIIIGVASVIAMVINLGAYAAEIIRAGIEATPKGQFEAAASLALSRVQTFLHVVLPPALKKVWPALTSQIIIVMLGSAVCGQIAAQELSYYANLIQSRNFRAFEAYIVATLIYLALSLALRHALNWIGPRWLFGRLPNAGR